MEKVELQNSPEYWIAKIQIELFNQVETYMKKNNLNRTQLAQQLGVSKGYITQVLNGDYDHRISKLVELALAVGVIPDVRFKKISENKASKNTKQNKEEKVMVASVDPQPFEQSNNHPKIINQ